MGNFAKLRKKKCNSKEAKAAKKELRLERKKERAAQADLLLMKNYNKRKKIEAGISISV